MIFSRKILIHKDTKKFFTYLTLLTGFPKSYYEILWDFLSGRVKDYKVISIPFYLKEIPFNLREKVPLKCCAPSLPKALDASFGPIYSIGHQL